MFGVQSHNVTVHVLVLWLVCTHTIPFRILLCLSNMYMYTDMCVYIYIHMYIYLHVHFQTHIHVHLLVHVRVRVVCETNRTIWLLIPSKVFLKIAETEQFCQVKRMVGGIGNMLSSIFSQTENV